MSKDKNFAAFKKKGAAKAFMCGLGKEVAKKASQINNYFKNLSVEKAAGAKVAVGLASITAACVMTATGQSPELVSNLIYGGSGISALGLADIYSAERTGKTVLQNVAQTPKKLHSFVQKVAAQGRI